MYNAFASQLASLTPEAPPSEPPETPAKASRRPPGSGRRKGVPNKITRDVRDATQRRGKAALREIWKLALTAKDEKVRKGSLETWLAYAYGKPTEHRVLTGADGSPLHPEPEMPDLDLARLLTFALQSGVHAVESASPPAPRTERPRPLQEVAKQAHAAVAPEYVPEPSNTEQVYMDEAGRPYVTDERGNFDRRPPSRPAFTVVRNKP